MDLGPAGSKTATWPGLLVVAGVAMVLLDESDPNTTQVKIDPPAAADYWGGWRPIHHASGRSSSDAWSPIGELDYFLL